jgi:hypothetical protein
MPNRRQRRGLLDPPPETLQDSLNVLVGGNVRVDRSTEEIERRYREDLQFRVPRAIRGAVDRLRGREPEETTLLGLAFPESKPLLGGLLGKGQDERIILRDEDDPTDFRPRETIMHEFGHIADFRKVFPNEAKLIAQTTPKGKSRAEHYADTFMHVMDFLQGPQSRQLRTAGRLVGMMPAQERAVLVALLQHPLYANHPLNQR